MKSSIDVQQAYTILFAIAPIPRESLRSETQYRTIEENGEISNAKPLPCWLDDLNAQKKAAQKRDDYTGRGIKIEEATLFMSLVVPAFNEEGRLEIMLTEAVDYLRRVYGNVPQKTIPNGDVKRRRVSPNEPSHSQQSELTGWEIVVVSDGSTDKTLEAALKFARKLGPELSQSMRVVSLAENRGKGGAVTHGMKYTRGKYAIFADADGASKFEDLGKLIEASKKIEDKEGRGVAIGSRAHLVGSEAVVKVSLETLKHYGINKTQRSFTRNLMMHSFHLLLRILTPPATARIRDTQCGFKLFSRPSLPYIIPYMHSEGWIFDVEMLMLAESAGIPVVEVPIGWQEVKGSKLNVLWDSLGMAWGLAVLRAAWGLGVYRRQ